MIKPFETLFLYRVDSEFIGVYVDSTNRLHLNLNPVYGIKNAKYITKNEFLNLRELEKINLHIPYILSLLNE